MTQDALSVQKYLDTVTVSCRKSLGRVDCWLVCRVGNDNQLTGMPLAIYKKQAQLRSNFERHVRTTDNKFGVTVVGWKFDD